MFNDDERAERAAEGVRKDKPRKKKKSEKLKSRTNVAIVEKPAQLSTEQAEKKLTPLANEINTRFEKAAGLEGKADDHRLAAALRLNEAKQLCAASGIRFRAWVSEHIKEQSWETVRKLALVGGAPNPQLALEDLRGKNREANRQHREKVKKKELTRKVFGPAEALLAVKPDIAIKAVRAFAHENGMEVVSKTEVKELKQKAKEAETVKPTVWSVDALKAAFSGMAAKDKMEFVHWAAGEVGGRFVSALEPSDDTEQKSSSDDLLDIPPMLRRTRKT